MISNKHTRKSSSLEQNTKEQNNIAKTKKKRKEKEIFAIGGSNNSIFAIQ